MASSNTKIKFDDNGDIVECSKAADSEKSDTISVAVTEIKVEDDNGGLKISDSENNDELVNTSTDVNDEPEQKGKAKKAKQPPAPKKPVRYVVFVGNLSYSTTIEELKAYFSKAGNVKDARLVMDRNGGSKGCAFVEYTKNIDFQKAFSLHHTMLKNRRIKVEFSTGKMDDKNYVMKKRKALKIRAMRDHGKLKGSKKFAARINRKYKKKPGGGQQSKINTK